MGTPYHPLNMPWMMQVDVGTCAMYFHPGVSGPKPCGIVRCKRGHFLNSKPPSNH